MGQVEITCTKRDGIFYPDLKLPEHTDYEIGKYGRLYLAYLKKHCRGTMHVEKAEGENRMIFSLVFAYA